MGRGGRLGHPEMQIHLGAEAVIHPRPVEGLQGQHVRSVACAKHHTLAVTAEGALFAWGTAEPVRRLPGWSVCGRRR